MFAPAREQGPVAMSAGTRRGALVALQGTASPAMRGLAGGASLHWEVCRRPARANGDGKNRLLSQPALSDTGSISADVSQERLPVTLPGSARALGSPRSDPDGSVVDPIA